MKKMLAMVMVLCVMSAFFAGCGAKEETPANGKAETTETAK